MSSQRGTPSHMMSTQGGFLFRVHPALRNSREIRETGNPEVASIRRRLSCLPSAQVDRAVTFALFIIFFLWTKVMMMKLPTEEKKSPRVHLLVENMENSLQEPTRRNVSIMIRTSFHCPLETFWASSEGGGAMTRTARNPARCP